MDVKTKAPETECISFPVTVNADDKKMMIDEMVINKKEMVLEVLMADNPSVPAKTLKEFIYLKDFLINDLTEKLSQSRATVFPPPTSGHYSSILGPHPIKPHESIVETDDSSVDVSKTMKADEVLDVNDITVGFGFSNKDLVNSDVSQDDDCKPLSPASNNCFDKIIYVAKEFIPIKFMKEGTIQQQSCDTLKEGPKVSKNDDFVGSSDISSHSMLYPASMSNEEVNCRTKD
ncbi:hypothetical protein L1987_06778 [Smallanthus sonchifolius]|uniref:Uncharacterized protein n=1 Tax=Smallanthus sonchifolius TaxID=185202 RepID=A0ACB9JZ36_9ASTR|nr:hypothetical protein L1987_06778 [Smallanthus sonchifolius]